jgi:hypothetical protein
MFLILVSGEELNAIKIKENTKKNLLEFTSKPYINKNTKRIGFPLLDKDPEILINYMEHNNTLLNFMRKKW